MLQTFVLSVFLGSVNLLPAADSTPTTRYFFILFGGQSVPFKPRTAHTWATYVKTTPNPDGTIATETVTISWLPVTADVHPLRLRSEVGKNYTLEETLAIAAQHNSQVSMWGPFEIDVNRYELAAAHARFLESGIPRYRVLDTPLINQNIMHCVHAVTFADPVLKRALQPVIQVGEPGTSKLAVRYDRAGAYIGGPVTHDWVLSATGIDQHPILHREPGERISRRWVR